MIYLDNAATTKPLDGLPELAGQYMSSLWFNPSALYAPAVGVKLELDVIRRQILDAFSHSSDQHRCVFTSGGTESANMVLKSGISRRKDANVVVGGFEHQCVEEAAKAIQARGIEIRHAACDTHGYIDTPNVLSQVDEKTALVCVMHVNNETGAKNDICAIAAAVKRKNPKTLFFSDGVQAFLRISVPDTSHIDYYSVSAHKIHALKGTGALFYSSKTPLKPFLDGGGQELGLRSGTENTFGILSFAAAAQFFTDENDRLQSRRERLYSALWDGVRSIRDSVILTPPQPERRCSHILCVSFPGIHGETLMHCLEDEEILISTGSACSSKKGKSRMEMSLGIDSATAEGVVRISLGAFNSESDVDMAVAAIRRQVEYLRSMMRSTL